MGGELYNVIIRNFLARVFFAVILIAGLTQTASAQTRVETGGPCTVNIVVPIEIHGPRATPALAARWKKNIEDKWNGPTQEIIDQIARDHESEMLDPDHPTWDKEKLDQHYDDFMTDIGADTTCATVNCCQICITVDIKIRGDDATDGYHQIEAVPNHGGEWDTLGSIPGIGPYIGNFEVKWHRSYVSGIGGQENVMSGSWGDDPHGNPAEAHEVGHLMGLDDKYSDVENEAGETYSEAHAGHDHDLMGHSQGWPQMAGYNEILAKAGISCNCCKSAQDLAMGTNLMIMDGGEAIALCDIPAMEASIQKLRDQKAEMGAAKISPGDKYQMAKRINDAIAQLQRAIDNCPKKRPTTGSDRPMTGLMTGGFSLGGTGGYTLGQDSTTWCEYGDGTGEPPTITPIPPGDGDDPRDAGPPDDGTPPDDGDDPRDAGPPDDGTPPDDSDDPRDAGPPDDGDDPRDTGRPDLPGGLPGTTTTDDGDDPRDTDTPEEDDGDDPSDVPGPTVYVKAKTSLLQGGGQTGKAVAGQQVKLFAPSTNVALPSEGGTKIDQDSGADPLQCVTDQKGECAIELEEVLVTGNRVQNALPQNYELGITADTNKGVTVAVPDGAGTGTGTAGAGSGTPSGTGTGLPPEVEDKVTGSVKLGDTTYYRLGYDLSLDSGLKLSLGMKYNLDWSEDYCRDKQPGPPEGFIPDTADLNALSRPGATVSFVSPMASESGGAVQ